MNVDKKKYFILMPPMLIIGLYLFYFLPANKRPYVFLVPIVFWLIYYTWLFIERIQKKKL
ncbi:hypothetical protein [Paenibacillus macquariensis]|uniref:hypothetical protein n=1 Tax=Paenibacillus macquariensis TaxID=948756 RepID=UPI000838967C|nr:hypothetical protein [Paenibacillus macquariensis]MEC0093413.1 hypothetical protein [Paenibacillus macquariensis]